MRTDTQKNPKCDGSSHSDVKTETMKAGSVRMSLHPLQVAAGDKENLVGAGRKMHTFAEMKDIKADAASSRVSNVSNSPKKKSGKHQENVTVSAEDLTTKDGPSENYWQMLAETRRKALEKTLVENQQLHDKLRHLTEENHKYQELLSEAQGIIDTLNEVILEMNNEDSIIEEENNILQS